MIAPLSGAAPVNPSVMLLITAPEFFGVEPAAKTGVKLAVISVRELVPNGIVVVQGLETVMLSFCIRRFVPLNIGVVFESAFFVAARLA